MRSFLATLFKSGSASATELHFKGTHKSLKKIDKDDIFAWLMRYGYFPEPYVLPPFLRVNKFKLANREIFNKVPKGRTDPIVDLHELAKITYPKNQLTDITFGVIQPDIYHDICYWLHDSWDDIIKHLFGGKRSIYSYSFPIPIDTNTNLVTKRRAERMIYEYIEGAEHDLLIDGVNHTHVVQIDIKNFYPSIYTHSICWAISKSRKKDSTTSQSGFYKSIGNKLDMLLQRSNDRQTNGIPIGPAVTDLIAECILSAVDQNIKLPDDCFGIRFKDDYRIVCHSEDEAKTIVKRVRRELDKFNLVVNNEKTCIKKYPEGLQRPWIIEYESLAISFFKDSYLDFKSFKLLYANTLKIHDKYPSQAIIDKFLGNLINCRPVPEIMVNFRNNHEKEIFVAYLWQLKLIRPKALGMILGALEHLSQVTELKVYINKIVTKRFEELNRDKECALDNSFEYLWLYYYIKTNGIKSSAKHVDAVLSDMHKTKTKKWQSFYTSHFKSDFYEWPLKKSTKSKLGNILNNVAIFQDS